MAALPSAAGATLEPGHSLVGGGTQPLARLQTMLVTLAPLSMPAEVLAARLRDGVVPLLGRLERGRLLLDPRTLAEEEIAEAASAVAEALA